MKTITLRRAREHQDIITAHCSALNTAVRLARNEGCDVFVEGMHPLNPEASLVVIDVRVNPYTVEL